MFNAHSLVSSGPLAQLVEQQRSILEGLGSNITLVRVFHCTMTSADTQLDVGILWHRTLPSN